MCNLHYQRTWRLGTHLVASPRLHGTVAERFWRHVEKRPDGECWQWTGAVDKNGYGVFRTDKPTERAHRVSFRLAGGSLTGHLVLHSCNNPGCVNPAHLRAGSHGDNMLDRHSAGHYPKGDGHPMRRRAKRLRNGVAAP
jgi:hypothetical protein